LPTDDSERQNNSPSREPLRPCQEYVPAWRLRCAFATLFCAIAYPNAQEVGIEEGFLTFVNQLDTPNSKAVRFKTSLPFVWKQAGGHDPGDQFKPR
jgi:hypothetical protein